MALRALWLLYAVFSVVALAKLKGKHEKEQVGVVLLDGVTFPKVIPHATLSTLVLVHSAAGDGDYGSDSIRQDFYAFAEKSQLHGTSDMVLYAHLMVSESEPANAKLATSLGLAPDLIHPKILFFKVGEIKPVEYPTQMQVNHVALSRWMAKQVDEYFLPTVGLIQSFKPLIVRFMRASGDQQSAIIAEATALAPSVELKDKENAKTHIKFMEKIKEQGPSFVQSELARLEELVSGERISKSNQILLQRKVNILHSFDLGPRHDGSEL